MRLPPRQSTAEADLMVPFQLVRLQYLLVQLIFAITFLYAYMFVLT